MNNFNLGFTFTGYDRVSSVAKRVNSSLNQTKQVGETATNSITSGIGKIAVAYAGLKIGGAIIGLLNKTTDSAKRFEKGMAEVSTLVNTNTVNMKGLSKQVLGLSKQFGEMPVDTAKALYTTISAGFTDTADATEILKTSMKLAVGGVTDVNTALDGMTSTLNAWGLSSKEAMNVSDAMFKAMKAGKTTIGELSANIGQVATLASTLGVSYKEVLSSASALTLAGLNTGEAMTSLKSLLGAVINQSTQSVKVAKRLGIAFDVQSIKAMGFAKWLEHVKQKTNGSATAIAKLFGRKEAITGFMALTGNQFEKFKSILDEMRNSAGSTEEAYKKMANTMAFRSKRIKAQWEVLKITIGNALKPVISVFQKGLLIILNLFNGLSKKYPVLSKIVIGFLGITIAIIGLVAVIALLNLGFTTLIPIVISFGVALWTALAPILPIILGITAVIGLLYLAWKNNFLGLKNIVSGFIDGLSALWEGIKQGFASVGDVFAPLKNAFSGLYKAFEPIIDLFSSFNSKAQQGTKNGIGFAKVMKIIGIWIGKTLGFIIKGIAFVISLGVRIIAIYIKIQVFIIKSVINMVKAIISNWEKIKASFISVFQSIWDFIKSIISNIKNLFIGAINFYIGIWMSIITPIINIFQVIWNYVSGWAIKIKNTFVLVADAVATPFIIIFKYIKAKFDALMNWIRRARDYVASLWDDIKNLPGKLLSKATFGLVQYDNGGGMTSADEVEKQIQESKQNRVMPAEAQTRTIIQKQNITIDNKVPEIKVNASLNVDGRKLATTVAEYSESQKQRTFTRTVPVGGV